MFGWHRLYIQLVYFIVISMLLLLYILQPLAKRCILRLHNIYISRVFEKKNGSCTAWNDSVTTAAKWLLIWRIFKNFVQVCVLRFCVKYWSVFGLLQMGSSPLPPLQPPILDWGISLRWLPFRWDHLHALPQSWLRLDRGSILKMFKSYFHTYVSIAHNFKNIHSIVKQCSCIWLVSRKLQCVYVVSVSRVRKWD